MNSVTIAVIVILLTNSIITTITVCVNGNKLDKIEQMLCDYDRLE